jgi:HAD superfamily hydrolase (TIGR01509 family)
VGVTADSGTAQCGLRALLFDFDGLLLDTESTEFRAWSEVYERHGHVLEPALWANAIGTIGGFDPVAHLATLGVALDADAVVAQHLRNLDLCALELLRPGVAELLDEADRRSIATAVVSSSSRGWIVSHLETRGLLERFAELVTADGDPDRAKPRPTLYLEALERLGVRAGEAIAFEDSPNGIAAATSAGIYCVAVPNAITSALDLSRANLIVDSLDEIDLDALAPRCIDTS